MDAERPPITVHLEPSDDGGYTASSPQFPGCVSEGDTLADALHNFVDAVDLWNGDG